MYSCDCMITGKNKFIWTETSNCNIASDRPKVSVGRSTAVKDLGRLNIRYPAQSLSVLVASV